MTMDPRSVEACLARMKADEERLRSAPEEELDLVPLEEMDDEDLEAIVKMAKTGGNELMQSEARQAENILQNRAERAHERWLSDYYGGGAPTPLERLQQDQADARRYR